MECGTSNRESGLAGVFPKPQPIAKKEEIIALILLGIGALMSIVGGIWFLVAAFQTSIGWGIGCLLCGFVGIAFLFMHWDAAKKPFLVSLGGGVFYVLAGVVAGGGSGSSY